MNRPIPSKTHATSPAAAAGRAMWPMLPTPARSVQPGQLAMPALLAAACLALAGCASPPPQTVQCKPPTGARPAGPGPALVNQEYGTVATPIPTNAVLFTHEALARGVSVQALFAARTETGTVQVSARLVSCLDQALVLRARTSFMQKSTAPAEAPSAWQNVYLPARATAVYMERSLGAEEVALYLVELAPVSP